MKKALFLLTYLTFSLQSFGQAISLDEKLTELLENSVPIIKCNEAKQMINKSENILIFDTRSKTEFEVSALKNAKFIDYDSFDPKLFDMPDKQDTIIFYCTVGYRSEKIGAKFKALGYANVLNLYGGILEWKNSGNIVYKNNEIPTDSVHTYDKEWSRWLYKGVKIYD